MDEPRCWHMVCYQTDESGVRTPVGAIRLVTPPHPSYEEGPENEPEGNYLKVGRLATVKEFRGRGVGKLLVEAAVKFASENRKEVGCRDVDGARIDGEWDGRFLAHAQIVVKRVWEKMGFVVDEGMGEWIEEGEWKSVYANVYASNGLC
jgi:GNAT superfamily N-acetyltransferase